MKIKMVDSNQIHIERYDAKLGWFLFLILSLPLLFTISSSIRLFTTNNGASFAWTIISLLNIAVAVAVSLATYVNAPLNKDFIAPLSPVIRIVDGSENGLQKYFIYYKRYGKYRLWNHHYFPTAADAKYNYKLAYNTPFQGEVEKQKEVVYEGNIDKERFKT